MLADCAPVLFWMSDADKQGVYFNKGWLDFTGRPLERELGAQWLDNIHRDDLPALAACEEAFAARVPFQTRFRLRGHDGEYRWMLDSGTPRFGPDGDSIGFVGSCIDMHDSVQAEEMLRS